jgi:hypothetical protein
MIMQDDENIESLPWYRYGMVWMIIMLPLTVVVAALFTVGIAMQNAPILNNHTVDKVSTVPLKRAP